MPTVTKESSRVSHRSKKVVTSSFNLKLALDKLTSASKEWSAADSKANHYLYGLLGEIYETIAKIGKNKAAKEALQGECARSNRITEGRNFKIAKMVVPALLIAYTIGNKKNESKRSQWKTTLSRAKGDDVPATKAAFSEWLNDAGGIEGVISKGKQKASHKATPPVDHKATLDTIAMLYSQSKLPLTVDLSNAKSFSDKSFVDNYALVLVQKSTDPDTASSTYAILDVVNDKDLLNQAAERLKSENGTTH